MAIAKVACSLLVATILVAGCLSDSPPQPGALPNPNILSFQDVAGDAPGFIDLLDGQLVQTSAGLSAQADVAKLNPANVLTERASLDGRHAYIALCWRFTAFDRDAANVTDCAILEIADFADGPLQAQYWSRGDGRCLVLPAKGPSKDTLPDWGCAWRVAFQMIGTSPATLQIQIPATLLPASLAGMTVAGFRAISWVERWDDTPVPLGPTWRSAGASACVQTTCAGRWVQDPQPSTGRDDVTDEAAASQASMVLGAPAAGPLDEAPAPLILADRGGTFRGLRGPRPDLDVLRVDLEETSARLAFVVQLAELSSQPSHFMGFTLGFGYLVYTGGFTVRAGLVESASFGNCGANCSGPWKPTPVSVAFQAGSPGTVRFTVDRSGMEPHPRGSLVTYAEVFMRDPSHAVHDERTVPPGVPIELEAGLYAPCNCELADPPGHYRLMKG